MHDRPSGCSESILSYISISNRVVLLSYKHVTMSLCNYDSYWCTHTHTISVDWHFTSKEGNLSLTPSLLFSSFVTAVSEDKFTTADHNSYCCHLTPNTSCTKCDYHNLNTLLPTSSDEGIIVSLCFSDLWNIPVLEESFSFTSTAVEVWLTSKHWEWSSNKMVLDGVLISEANIVQYWVEFSGSCSNETRALPSTELN